MSYGDDDVDELFERAKSAYRREREQEQGRIQRDSRYAYDWVQSAIGFLTAIVNCFTAVWNAACYITTAVVEYRGESDDGHTLTVLRRFRKEYILQSGQPSRLLDLLEYQVIAPAVVRRLGVHPGRMAILEWLSGVIAMAVALIEEGREQEAYHLYKTQVLAVNRLIGGADE